MPASPSEKLVIAPQDLLDPRVDEQLARQLSFGMAAPPPRIADARTSLLQRPWFALMLAGALGALVGWAMIEPIFDDGVRFRGTTAHVKSANQMEGAAALEVGGVKVWVPPQARVRSAGGNGGVGELHDGLRVEVRGEHATKSDMVIAYEVRILGTATGSDTVDVKNLLLRERLVGVIVFPLLAALVGLFIGAADGLLSRALRRGAVCGLVGLGIGLSAGLVATLLAELMYAAGQHFIAPLRSESGALSTVGFLIQMVVRGLAWSMAGAAMGLGQGVALRSKKLALNGLLGGMVGALLGGLLFDPIDYLLHRDQFGAGAASSRAAGFMVIGGVTGLMIGIVELMARDAWLKMLTGALAGKEFVLYKSPTLVGSSPKSDIYLFKDSQVDPTHAAIQSSGEGHEIVDRNSATGIFVNGRRISRKRLENGDQIRIGATVLNFTEREA
jgi:hypothetical protein